MQNFDKNFFMYNEFEISMMDKLNFILEFK